MSEQKIIIGNCLDVLKGMPDSSVDVCVTSPPYWALRDYGSEPVIWGGREDCEHDWCEHKESARGGVNEDANIGANKDGVANNRGHPTVTQYCTKCGAWKGQLGLEPSPLEYIDHLIMIFDEVKRVLKPTGACWVNLGDTYATTSGFVGDTKGIARSLDSILSAKKVREGLDRTDFPQKTLCQIPSRFAIAMTDRGGILRNDVIWCLDGDTEILCKTSENVIKIPISKISEILEKGEDVFVPSIDPYRNLVWVKIKNAYDRGIQESLKISFTNGKSVICSPNHEFPTKSTMSSDVGFMKKPRIKKASDLNSRDKFVFARGFDLPNGCNSIQYTEGYCVGFFMAEGNFEKNRCYNTSLKNSRFSQYAQKRWKDHIKREVSQLEFACGIKDIERGFLTIIENNYRTRKYIYGNKVLLKSNDVELISLVQSCVIGSNCHEYHLSEYAYSKGSMFLKGVIDGFLNGDGSFDAENDRWRVGICENWALMKDLEGICTIIGYTMRFESKYKLTLKANAKEYITLHCSIRKTDGFHLSNAVVRSIEHVEDRHMWDIEVEEYGDPRIDRLYFIANGLWTHNCKPNVMPTSVKDRFTTDFEHFYFFVKQPKYYFKQQFEPIDEESVRRSKRAKHNTLEHHDIIRGTNSYDFVHNDPNWKRWGDPEKGRNCRSTWVVEEKNTSKWMDDDIESSVRQGMNQNRGNGVVEKRYSLPSQCVLVEFLRSHTKAKDIIEGTDIPLTKAEHWFRSDEIGFAYPSVEDWLKVREKISDDSELFRMIDKGLTEVTYETDDIMKNSDGETRNARCVWDIPTKGEGYVHCAMFPIALIERPIDACCPPGGTVLDPFAGSGTVLEYCYMHDINAVGIEINPAYESIIKKRSRYGQTRLELD